MEQVTEQKRPPKVTAIFDATARYDGQAPFTPTSKSYTIPALDIAGLNHLAYCDRFRGVFRSKTRLSSPVTSHVTVIYGGQGKFDGFH